MNHKYDKKYMLKKPQDEDGYFRAYAVASSTEELAAVNAVNTEPVKIKKEEYAAVLVDGSSRHVSTSVGNYLMCIYKIEAR